jgi:hypothetical protein
MSGNRATTPESRDFYGLRGGGVGARAKRDREAERQVELMPFVGLSFGSFLFCLLLARCPLDSFGKHFAPRLTIPLLESYVGDFPLDQELRELASLSLALEWHCAS